MPWETVDECPFCGSDRVEVDGLDESGYCPACRSRFGGALVWKSPLLQKPL
jgi:transposase-like protein